MEKTPHELVDELDIIEGKIDVLKPQHGKLSEGDKGNLLALIEKRIDILERLGRSTGVCESCRGAGKGKEHYADEVIKPLKVQRCDKCRGTGRNLET